MGNKVNYIMMIGLILIIIFLSWKIDSLNDQNQDINEQIKRSIIMNDSLVKLSEGRYVKMVDYFNTEKDLKNELKESNEELYINIKKQGEKILSLNNIIMTLKNEINQGFGKINTKDSNKIDLELKYPNEKESFINWKGSVDKKTNFYKGEWSFKKFPIQIVLTEEKRGIWKSYINTPTWLKIDSMYVNSLPPEEYKNEEKRKVQFLLGGGYIKSLSPMGYDGISVGGGINLFDKHHIIINTNTNKEINVNYYFKFQNIKKRSGIISN
jgi:hypothetical protein